MKNYIKYFLLLGDLIVLYSALVLSLILRNFSLVDGHYLAKHIIYFSPIIFVWIFVFYLIGLYKKQIFLFKHKSLEFLLTAQSINATLAMLIFYFLPLAVKPKTILIIYLFATSLMIYFWRVKIFPNIFSLIKIKFIPLSNIESFKNALSNIKKDFLFDVSVYGLESLEFCDFKFKEAILVIMNDDDNNTLNKIIQNCIVNGQAYIPSIMTFNDFLRLSGKVSLNDKSIVEQILSNMNSFKYKLFNFGKDVIDFLILLLISVPAIISVIILYFVIYFFDGKPVFYKSKRRGFAGKDFYLYKFRTLNGVDSGEEAKNSKLKETKLGSLLRKTRLDELPQLWSVLKGDMSFVGPRPEISEIADEYEKNIDMYHLRYLVKPGITGWAQVHQSNPPKGKIDIKATKEKLAYDLFYLIKLSPLLDLQIILQTISSIFALKGK